MDLPYNDPSWSKSTLSASTARSHSSTKKIKKIPSVKKVQIMMMKALNQQSAKLKLLEHKIDESKEG